jgi:hydrogenase expression/formation protein HypC
MCLGIPGRVIDIYQKNKLLMAKVSFGPLNKEVCISMVPEVKVGEFVVVHVGFALNILDEQAAKASIDALKQAA